MRRLRDEMIPSRKITYRVASALKQTKRRAKFKAQVYEAYGGYVCACCGETEPLFLSIDHVNNDGYEMRKAGIHNTAVMYEHLVKAGFPPGYQVLCMNCNFGKARNNGVCPHQTAKESSTVILGGGVGSSEPKRTASDLF